MKIRSAGTAPGERQLLGPQTTGREYQNLSQPEYAIRHTYSVKIPMRDGVHLLADLYQPKAAGRFPVLVAVSPYARQAQFLGLPAGMIESGQIDFWVPRGYVHLIVNVRGTCGSEGTFAFNGRDERRDLYDMIEWAAEQAWSDGNVGMMGVSYFAIEQFYAALEHPPHLRAIFPWSGSIDFYREALWHGGICSGRLFGLFFNALGMVSKRKGNFFHSWFFRALNILLELPAIHRRFGLPPKDQIKAFNRVVLFDYNSHPWDDVFYEVTVEHQFYDDYWQERNMEEAVDQIDIPIYLGADWENVGLHLNTPFLVVQRLAAGVPWRVAMSPRGGLQWPWESMHIEALAWYDQWLKGRETGIMDGPRFRYFVEGANEWRATDRWPLPEVQWTNLWLNSDGTLSQQQTAEGSRDYLYLPTTMVRGHNTNKPELPMLLQWQSVPQETALEIIGPFVLHLEASSTAADTDWIVKVCAVSPDGTVQDLTQGWLRASHRALDKQKSLPYRPYHPHLLAEPLTPGETTSFEIEILPTAHRLLPGYRLRLILTSQDDEHFAMQGLSHYPLGIPAHNTILSSSKLTMPLCMGKFA